MTTPSPLATDVRLIAIGRSESGRPFTVVSDPAFVRWQAEGASTCGATWSDEELAETEEQADYGNVSAWESPFCNCSGNSGDGLCSTCGKKLLPF